MKGFASYNDWSCYATPSSNLSAFATPFSVNRPSPIDVSTSFVDPVDSVRTSFPFRPNNFSAPIRESDSDSDSESLYEYGYAGLHVSDSYSSQLPRAKPTLVESQQYFNSYALHDQNSSVVPDHWSSFSGFTASEGNSRADYAANKSYELGFHGQSVANQFADLSSGKGNPIGFGSSLCSNQTNFTGSGVDERMNLGCQDISDSHGEVPHRTGWEEHSLPTDADLEYDKSCWWRTTKPMPVDISHTSVLQSPSLSLEPHLETPLKLAVDSWNHPFSFTGVYDQHLWQQDQLSRVDAVSSTPITGSVTDLNVSIFVPDGDLGHNNFYDVKQAHPSPSLGTAGCFSIGHLSMHLDRNEPSSSNNAMISDTNLSGDVVDYMHKARHEFQNPYPNLGSLSLRRDAIQGVNSVDKTFECVGDLCNPSVDSPCWKGAPTANFSYYESFDALPHEQVPKNEICFGSDTESNVRKASGSSFKMHVQTVDKETSLAGSPRKISEERTAADDCKPDGAVSVGTFQSESCCDYRHQYQDDIVKMKENSVPPTKPNDRESGFSHDEHHVTGENKLVSQKLHTLSIGGVDAGCNENICSASGTSHTGGHALSLSSSVKDAPTTPEISSGKASTEKLNVQMLVDSMQNLSQLLFNHCSNDAYELGERDRNILRNVISNLSTCLLKNAEQINPDKECIFNQPETSRCAGESCGLQEGSQLTKIALESSMDALTQKAYLCFGSRKSHLMPSDSISSSGSTKMTKAENMTKALKNILSENFNEDESTESRALLYKNLWLEAEAALCSVSCKARYNKMKVEMEKHLYKQRDMEEQSNSVVTPNLSRCQSSEIEVNKCPNTDSYAQDLPVLDATNPKELSQLKLSSDLNMPNSLTLEAEGSHNLYSFIRNYAVSGANKEAARNDEASVMTREKLYNLETPSDIENKLEPREVDDLNQVNFSQDFLIPAKNKIDNDTSVLARFHIPKSRAAEDSSYVSSSEKFEFSAKGIEDTVITKDELKGSSLNANPSFYAAVDKSIPKENHLDLEDSQEFDHCRTYELQLPNYHSDGLASDWEHV